MGLITSKEIRPVTPLLYTVDGGSTTPNNRYPSIPKDYDIRLLHKLIVSRRLAPFYRGTSEPTVGTDMDMDRSTDSVDCPICFLTYPANINYTRCCDQPICTECFLHIKPSSRTLHTTCPFCIESLFGVIYSWWNLLPDTTQCSALDSTEGRSKRIRRGQSISPNHERVVLTDHLRSSPKEPTPHKSTYNRSMHRLLMTDIGNRERAYMEATWMIQQSFWQPVLNSSVRSSDTPSESPHNPNLLYS